MPEDAVAFQFADAVYLTGAGLWLDPHRSKPFAFVSHAHADHFAAHQRILCSRGACELIIARFGRRKAEFVALEFGEMHREGSFQFTLFPAGHIAGSAQLFVEDLDSGATLLYTGDFKTRPSLAAEPIEIHRASALIMETTFGEPRYIFPPAEETTLQIADFVQSAFDDGAVPVVQGYSLGKAQELIAAIHASLPDAKFLVHPSVQQMNEVVRKLGFHLPDCERIDPDHPVPDRHVLVIPPAASRAKAYRPVEKKEIRTGVATGWAIDPSAKYRYRVDEAFPLSDHAGYDELLDFVQAVDPDVVYTLHGSAAKFAAELRNRGRQAWSLISENQLELDLGLNQEDRSPDAAFRSASPGEPDSELAKFAILCQTISETPGKKGKRDRLAKYLESLPKDQLRRACRYLSSHCFSPAEEEQKAKSPAGWATIQRALVRASEMPEAEYLQLAATQHEKSRLALLVMHGKGGREAYSLEEVAVFFDSLATAPAPETKEKLLAELFRTVTPLQASILTGVILGDLRIGLAESLIEEALAEAFECPAPEVRKAQMYSGDIGHTAVLAKEGRLDQWELVLFRPLSCMLASEEFSPAGIWERLSPDGERPVWIEEKYDGIRAQLHKSEDRAELYARNLQRVTDEFPELIEAALNLPGDVVLDGEIIAYSGGRPLRRFDLETRTSRQRTQGDLFLGAALPAKFVAFDLLWINGRVLTETPLERRRARLEEIALPDAFALTGVTRAADANTISHLFESAREREFEGVIAKDADSHYTPGVRGKSWLKLKAAPFTLDAVVVRAEPGQGPRSHLLCEYHFAVLDKKSGSPTVVGKTSAGLTGLESEELSDYLQKHTLSVEDAVHVVKPDVVLEISYSSIRRSSRFESGYQIVSPRIKQIRRDKSAADIDTLETVSQRFDST